MDLPHLVHALIGPLLRSPALHFAVLGTILFVLISPPASTPPPRLVIPASSVEMALEEYQNLGGHVLSKEEKQAVVDAVVEQEVLYAYAQRLGMGKDPAVERRLAQIATFVADNPEEAKSSEERADEAAMLGLGEGDLVVRRILIDGAKRLIRAAVLIREPSEAALESHLREYPEDFLTTEQWRISQVTVDASVHRENTERDARRLLEHLRKGVVVPEETAEMGDPSFVASSLPALSARDLERRFGRRFAEALAGLPAGSWEGPISSRYGLHLVFIEEHFSARVPQLDEVRNEVRARLREKLADEWLAVRLEQLRSEFTVEIAGAGKEIYP
jgi:hypothetical protein